MMKAIISTAAAPTTSCTHRRSRTLGAKAPRKRNVLLVLPKRTSVAALAALGSGGDGPTGNGNNGCGRPFERCCGGDGDGEPQPQRQWRVSPQGIAVMLMGIGLYGAGQAGPAWAAQQSTTLPNSMDTAAAAAVASSLPSSDSDDEITITPVFRTLPDNYSPNAFDEEEKELVCPRQYRVRECIFVH